MKAVQTTIIITSVRSKVDRSLSLSITTPELNVSEKALFMELQGINCDMTITPIDTKEVEEYKINTDLETKTPGQRLRNVLYRLFEQNAEGYSDFDTYYRAKMEAFIEKLKSKLDD